MRKQMDKEFLKRSRGAKLVLPDSNDNEVLAMKLARDAPSARHVEFHFSTPIYAVGLGQASTALGTTMPKTSIDKDG